LRKHLPLPLPPLEPPDGLARGLGDERQAFVCYIATGLDGAPVLTLCGKTDSLVIIGALPIRWDRDAGVLELLHPDEAVKLPLSYKTGSADDRDALALPSVKLSHVVAEGAEDN
jgi:hypothetical protein